jgi:hypothetical protein
MNANNTVVNLAGATAPLTFNAASVLAFLGIATLIDNSNSPWMVVLSRYLPLNPIPQTAMVPGNVRQKILQSPRRHVSGQSDWLYALAWQIRQLPFDIGEQVCSRFYARKTIVKFPQKRLQSATYALYLLYIHVDTPYKINIYKKLS